MSEAVGGNVAAVLSGYVERITDLQGEVDTLLADRKEVIAEMKQRSLPKEAMLQELKEQEKMDSSDRQEARSQRRWAAALLGVPCYFSDNPVDFDETLDKTQMDTAQSLIKRVANLDEERADVKETLKELFKNIKGQGFSVTAVKAVVKMSRKDGAFEKWDEENTLVEMYRTAVM